MPGFSLYKANYHYFYRKVKPMNVIVTGASRGIGFEVVKILASDPQNKIIAIARNRDALDRLQNLCREESGNEIIIFSEDISSEGFDRELTGLVSEKMSHVNILINNAGLLINKPFLKMDEEDFEQMFSVNTKSAFFLVQKLVPLFKAPAHVLNIGSMGGYQGSAKFPGLSLYSASKGALAILTECLAEELKEFKIHVNCLALGSAQTEMLANAFPGYKAPVTAGEMADFVSGFALNGYKFFNGKILPVALSTP